MFYFKNKKIMKLFFLILFVVIFIVNIKVQSQMKFAVIGDYGKAGANELSVSNLVKSWNPEFIITLGDNNYELGEQATIDANIGQYYRQFIFPYTGSYGAGDTVNRFFPSLGNHDWYTNAASAYLNYFSLPGNERYYDFIKGNIHFFIIDSDPNEPDGVDSNSVQANWLKNSLAVSSQRFNLVYFHHPPYSSGSHGNNPYMNWPFKKWGADAVLSGHDHTYERININSFTYIINGLGGKSIYTFNTPIAGSIVRYNNNYGAMLVNSYEDSLTFRFYSISGSLKDNYKLIPSQKTLTLNILIEGFYNPVLNTMQSDTLKVFLRNGNSPYQIIDSSKGNINSSGAGTFTFTKANNSTPYYIEIIHRNSIETWSSSGINFNLNNHSYDFTTSANKSYGNNLFLKGLKYCVFSGDVNQDNYIDASDLSTVGNGSDVSLNGYVSADVTGDNFVDASDISIVEKNSFTPVTVSRP